MPTRYSSPLAVLLTVAVCFGATGRAAAQGNNEFRSMPLDQITRWLADSLPPATQLSYVRTDYDDEGTFRINAAIQVLSMRFAGCSLEYQERLTINSEPPDTRTHAANLADLSQVVTVVQASRPDDVEIPKGRWWAVLLRDAASRDRITSSGTQTAGRALAIFQVLDGTMAKRLANAFSAAIERCGGSA